MCAAVWQAKAVLKLCPGYPDATGLCFHQKAAEAHGYTNSAAFFLLLAPSLSPVQKSRTTVVSQRERERGNTVRFSRGHSFYILVFDQGKKSFFLTEHIIC